MVHTVGIDINNIDGTIFKHTQNVFPRTIQIVKCKDCTVQSIQSHDFMAPYELQLLKRYSPSDFANNDKSQNKCISECFYVDTSSSSCDENAMSLC